MAAFKVKGFAGRRRAVQNMTCELCLVTANKSLGKVADVRWAMIDFASWTATVMFDATAPVKATTDAGYASPVRK